MAADHADFLFLRREAAALLRCCRRYLPLAAQAGRARRKEEVKQGVGSEGREARGAALFECP